MMYSIFHFLVLSLNASAAQSKGDTKNFLWTKCLFYGELSRKKKFGLSVYFRAPGEENAKM